MCKRCRRPSPDPAGWSVRLSLACLIAAGMVASGPAFAAGPPSGGPPGGGQGQGSQSPQSAFPARADDCAVCTEAQPWKPADNRALSDAFNKNEWDTVQDILFRVLKTLQCADIAVGQCHVDVHPKHAYFSVLFLNETQHPPALSRVVVHKYEDYVRVLDPKHADLPEVYGNRIGAFELFDLRLLPRGVLVESQYQASPSSSALLGQLPSVLAQAAGGLKGAGAPAAAAIAHAIDGGTGAGGTSASTTFLVRRIRVPSSFKGRPFIEIPSVIPQVAITDQLLLSEGLERYIHDSLTTQTPAKLAAFNQGMFDNYTDKAKQACRKEPPAQQCLLQNLPPITFLDDPALIAGFSDIFTTYSALLSMFSAPQSTPPLSTQYTFGHLTRWAFSLGIGPILSTGLNVPVKGGMSSSNTPTLVRDNPTTPLTWIALDFHPCRYDETRFSPTFSERFRFFGGFALTPDAGVVAGAGIGLVRGLTVEAGYGVLLATVLPGNEQLNTMSTKTRRGALGVPFVGIGYSFQ
jgi:hypothetical protein